MKAIFLTDAHMSEQSLGWVSKHGRDYEAIIVGGDLAKGGPQQFVTRFLAGALSTGSKVVYVRGNSDSPAAEVPDGVVVLHGKSTTLGGTRIGGLGGSNRTPYHTIFEIDDVEARKLLDGMGPVDVLVSHCPPANTKCDRTLAGHVGSAPVREYVEKSRPSLVLSGHVHESRGIDNVGGTTVVNPGPFMEGKYAEVSLGAVVSVELKEADFAG